jgi:hypothetical protein
MPTSKPSQNQPNNSRYHGQHDIIDGHQRLCIFSIIQYLPVDPNARNTEAEEAEQRCVYQEQEEGFVVPQSHTRRKPRAMMIHLQHAGPAGRAMMSAIWFPRLAFLAISQLPIRFDGEVRSNRWCLCGQGAVAIMARRRSWTRKHSSRVRPVQEDVECNSEEGGSISYNMSAEFT